MKDKWRMCNANIEFHHVLFFVENVSPFSQLQTWAKKLVLDLPKRIQKNN